MSSLMHYIINAMIPRSPQIFHLTFYTLILLQLFWGTNFSWKIFLFKILEFLERFLTAGGPRPDCRHLNSPLKTRHPAFCWSFGANFAFLFRLMNRAQKTTQPQNKLFLKHLLHENLLIYRHFPISYFWHFHRGLTKFFCICLLIIIWI